MLNQNAKQIQSLDSKPNLMMRRAPSRLVHNIIWEKFVGKRKKESEILKNFLFFLLIISFFGSCILYNLTLGRDATTNPLIICFFGCHKKTRKAQKMHKPGNLRDKKVSIRSNCLGPINSWSYFSENIQHPMLILTLQRALLYEFKDQLNGYFLSR